MTFVLDVDASESYSLDIGRRILDDQDRGHSHYKESHRRNLYLTKVLRVSKDGRDEVGVVFLAATHHKIYGDKMYMMVRRKHSLDHQFFHCISCNIDRNTSRALKYAACGQNVG